MDDLGGTIIFGNIHMGLSYFIPFGTCNWFLGAHLVGKVMKYQTTKHWRIPKI